MNPSEPKTLDQTVLPHEKNDVERRVKRVIITFRNRLSGKSNHYSSFLDTTETPENITSKFIYNFLYSGITYLTCLMRNAVGDMLLKICLLCF